MNNISKIPLTILQFAILGSERDLTYSRVKSLSLDDYVIFYGVPHNVASLMSIFDLFLMPFLYEGLEIVLIEAQTSNLPFVVSKYVILQETKVSANYVINISLDSSFLYWVKTIVNIKLNTSRSNIIDKRLEDYDIKAISDKMMSFYLSNDNLVL